MEHDVLASLTDLSTHMSLPDRDRSTAQRLLKRLTTPLLITFQGPNLAQNESVAASLNICGETNVIMSVGGDLGNADIAIWCTQTFSQAEQVVWNRAHDALKDHSFLIAIAPESSIIDHLKVTADSDFTALHILSGPDNAIELKTIQAALSKHILRSMQAVEDSASMFVQKYAANVGPLTGKKQQRSPLPPTDAHSGPQNPPTAPASKDAMSCLTSHANRLAGLAASDDANLSASVLTICSEATAEILDVLIDGLYDRPEYKILCNTIECAVDNITLMSLENTPQSAVDAAAILLQVRKEMSVSFAA